MGQITLDKVTTDKIDNLRTETGAQTRGEVVRNAVRVYTQQLAAEKKAESAS